ncbi:MAG: D-sedoheptulose 7-phosphate isomerase [Rhizobiaceae bacterium]
MFDAKAFFDSQFDEHFAVARAAHAGMADAVADMLDAWEKTIRGGGKILFFGNGGSAADAQHIAAEFVIRFVKDRPAMAAIALTTDTSALTACGNDYGFDEVFARQIAGLGRPGDLAIGFSTSGNSRNILRGLEQARAMRIATGAFTGGSGGGMPALSDHTLLVPSSVTARIQEMHITLAHILCGALERRLGFA